MADQPVAAPPALTVTVRYSAAARAAAGRPEERLTIPSATGAAPSCTVTSVLAAAVARHGRPLERILERCSFLLDEVAVHGAATPVRDGQALDVLPPFAAG